MDAAEVPDRPALTDAWPLFRLRIRSEHLVLRLPTDDELMGLLGVARAGIHPPDEMPFGVAWTDRRGADFDRAFLQHHWEKRGAWQPDAWWLNLAVLFDGRPIGSQTIHATGFATTRTVDTGSWLGRTFQGRGLGTEMRSAILAFAFDGLGAAAAESSAFLDNAPSNAVSRGVGYTENGRASLAPRGESRETQLWRMTEDAWRSRERPPVVIEGLDACRSMFGV